MADNDMSFRQRAVIEFLVKEEIPAPDKNFTTAVQLLYPQPHQLKLQLIYRCCQIYAAGRAFYKPTRHEIIINRN